MGTPGSAASPASIPDDFGLTSDERKALFDQLIATIERLDGQVLEVRAASRRPKSWPETIRLLRARFVRARSKWDYKQVFESLNFAYPNEHAQVSYGPGFPQDIINNPRSPSVLFRSFWPERERFSHAITFVDPRLPAGTSRPMPGDEVIAINGRGLAAWLEENFNHCKHVLRTQCNAQFSKQLLWERLSWNSSMPLRYTLKRGPDTFEFDVPLMDSPPDAPQRQEPDRPRYEGFRAHYEGENAFLYVSTEQPRTAILRIRSFAYRPEGRVRTPLDEVKVLSRFWSGKYDHVIIDLSENRGGNDPLPYLTLLTHERHITQYTRVQFRRIREFADPLLQPSLFWRDPGRLAFYRNLRHSKAWDRIDEGQFLPPEPYFCGLPVGESCDRKYAPARHQFRGRVSVVIASGCMSSCDEFVLTLKKYLGSRMMLLGHPQFSDTGFSRLKVEVTTKPRKGSWVRVLPHDAPVTSETLVQQGVVVTRSVDERGRLADGKPLPVDIHVPLTPENQKTWYRDAVRLALGSSFAN